MSKNNQLYGWMGDSYYEVPLSKETVLIPENVDYSSSSCKSILYPELHQCKIYMFKYVADLITECNSKRAAFLQEFLIDNKVKEMYSVNNDYIIGLSYSIYNNNGQQISSGVMKKHAISSDAVVNSEISEGNIMDYRRAIVFDSSIEIQVPKISRYGIKNSYIQHPYTLVIDNITVSSTVGDMKYIIESDTQVKSHHDYHHATHCSHYCDRPNHFHFNNFASHFLTNARVGTTLIDQTVVPTKLEIPPEYSEVEICSIDCVGESYTIKIDEPVEIINVNIEVLFDNIVSVYDKDSINAIILMNNEEPDVNEEIPDDELDIPIENPDNNNSDKEDNINDDPTDNPDTPEDSTGSSDDNIDNGTSNNNENPDNDSNDISEGSSSSDVIGENESDDDNL